MANYITMGSMADKLLSFVSTTMVRDSNYDIALEMIKNYEKLRGMSITEVAGLCFVSQASISRFCRFMGFEGYKEFREYLNVDFSIHNDYSKQLSSMLKSDPAEAVAAYRDELTQTIYATLDDENIRIMPQIVQLIHEAKYVSYFAQHFLQETGHFLQSKLMMMGKYIEQSMHYEGQLECAEKLDNNSIAIICTVGGSYMTRYVKIWETIVRSRCKLIVITQNMSSPYLNAADYVLRCGTSNKDDIGKYSALMLIDYMIMCYMRRYDS